MKNILLIIFCFTQFYGNAQEKKNYLSLGGRKWGLGFGYAKEYNGLRFNLQDYSLERTNGIHFLFSSRGADYIRKRNLLEYNRDISYTNGLSFAIVETPFQKVNGISISLFHNQSPKVNGLSLGLFSLSSGLGLVKDEIENKFGRVQNGISIAGFLMSMRKGNGIIIAGIWMRADTLNGLIISPTIHGIASDKSVLNGIAIAADLEVHNVRGLLITASCDVENMKGVQIGLLNRAKNIKGVQIGLLNNVKSNPKLLRWLPIFNTHFGRKN